MTHFIKAPRSDCRASLQHGVLPKAISSASFALASSVALVASAADPASSGSTDITQEGFQSTEEPAEGESKDATSVNVAAGALFAAGNSKSLAVTGAADARIRRGVHQGKAALAANYAQAGNQDGDNALAVTVENYQGLLRYDHFIKSFAPFLSFSGRHDRFQGLDFRLNVSPGLAFYFVDQAKQQFWSEVGYDFQHDIRTGDALNDAEAVGEAIEKTESRHNARLYVGYNNELNAVVTFKTGIEYIQEIVDPENTRINWDLGLASKIGSGFSMATTVSIKYDNNPLPEIEKTDVVSAINLVYGIY